MTVDVVKLFGSAHDVVNVILVHDHTALRAACLGAELGTEVVDVDLAVAESFHGLETIPR
jgi:hypothetical protein